MSRTGEFFDFYHGTSRKNAEGIRKEGLRPPPGVGVGWTMLTTNREQAARYAVGQSGDVVLHFRVPHDEVARSIGHPAPHTAYGFPDAVGAGIMPGRILSKQFLVEDEA